MGWNLLRRKNPLILALCLAAAPIWAGQTAVGASAAARAPSAGPLAFAAGVFVPDLPDLPAPPRRGGPAGPLPCIQGNRGEEIYSLDIPDEPVIGRYVEGLLAQRRDWLQAVLLRSIRYRVVIAAAIADKGLPREIRFLPAVESGFQPAAVSPRGAVGLWQLMRNTASPYGLHMDQWVDERRDFIRSTDASLEKLEENYAQFGDWYLALAAYNCGLGRLAGILARNPGADFWTLRKKGVLPRETAAFVPQFLAITRILSYPGRYGLDMGWEPSQDWAQIPLESCVDLRILSRQSGVPLDVLSLGNRELNFPMTPPASYQYVLKVPEQYEQAVKDTLASATVPLMRFNIHVVKPGDTLYDMARQYRVTVDMILQFNPRLTPRTLQIGSRILIPMTPVRSEG